MKTWILILMLLLASSLQAQEFTVVGDHANRDPGSSWYGVDLTATNQWTAIDDLHCNWLKLSVEASSPHSSEQMLEHPGYKYIVDRVNSNVSPYSRCNIQYINDSQPRKAVSSWLAKYVLGSFAIRLHPESSFDFDVRNDVHGEPFIALGATRTPYVNAPPEENAIKSKSPDQTPGIVASYPAANTNLNDQILRVPANLLHYLTLRARLESIPATNDVVYTIRILRKDGGVWTQMGASIQIVVNDFMNQTGWLEITKLLNLTNTTAAVCEKDIEISWNGTAEAYLDWVEMGTQCSHEVLRDATRESTINTQLDWLSGLPAARRDNIGKLYSTDEAVYPEFLNLHRINSLITDRFSGNVSGWGVYLDIAPAFRYRWGFYQMSGIDEMSITGYMFGMGHIDDGTDTAPIHANMHNAAQSYKVTAEPVRDGLISGKEFWPIVQTHAEISRNGRFPYPEEIKANIGIGLSYGAKGIVEHLVLGTIDYQGLVGPTTFAYRDQTSDTVSVLNQRLRGTIGQEFLDLSWRSTFEGGFDNLSALQGIVLQNVGNAHCSGIITSSTGTGSTEVPYVQLAHLTKSGLEDYLFLVNKRTQLGGGGDRFIDVAFTSSQSLFMQDVESHAIEVIPANGTKSTFLKAGEFCLLRTTGNSLTSPLTVDNVMYVRENAEFTISSSLTVAPGAVIHIENGATLKVDAAGSIHLNEASIVCTGDGTLQLVNPQGIQGIGTIITPRIELASELIVPDGSEITFLDGGSFGFMPNTQGSDNHLSVFGELRFRGTNCAFSFEPEFDDFFIFDHGIIDIEGLLSINGLPDINNWNQGQFLVRGLDETQRATLIMRDRAELNNSSILDMEFAEISTASESEEWDGIMIVSPEALCRLRYVDINRIYCDPVWQGSGIHFYEAANPANLVSHCNIIRSDKPDELGDGIFLQPGGTGSYAKIECTTTGDDWWTGVTAVSSQLEIMGLTSSDNLRGLGSHLAGTIIEMQQSILDYNLFEGIYSERSILYLGEYSAGYNQIRENGNTQIDLRQTSRIYRTISVSGTQNDIGHFSTLVPRIVADVTSSADVQSNYWMTSAPLQSMFVEATPGSIGWNPFLTQSAIASFSEWSCGQLFSKTAYPMLSGNPTPVKLPPVFGQELKLTFQSKEQENS